MSNAKETTNRRILVVDDNPEIFNDFKTILVGEIDTSALDTFSAELFGSEAGTLQKGISYQLDYASQGREGYEKVKRALAQERPYQLAFVDMRMPPGWDGLETIEHIWQADPNIQVTICTAYSDHSWEEITRRLGTTDKLLLLKKPFDSVEVAQIAATMTEKWFLSRQAAQKMEEMDRKVEERTRELERANERLLESQERFRTLVEHAGDAIFTINPEGKLVDINRQACISLGYSREELLDMNVEDVDAAFDSNEFNKEFRQKLRGGVPITLETIHKRKDGSTFPVEARAAAIHLDGQRLVLAVARNITGRKQAEEERHKMETQMHQAKKMESLNVMAGSIAHNFNNLLAVVLGNMQLALLNLSTESTAKINVEKAEKSALKAAELSTLMLTYVGQNYVTFSSINLADIVEDTIKSLEESIPENISMTFQPVRPFPEIEAVPDQVRQVVTNVFANALEAIGENRGTITVAAGVMTCDRACLQQSYLDEELPKGDYVYLEISDTGCGMDEEMKSKIFDPYFTTKFTGRGLGLAAVLGILRGHRGAVIVDSEPGKGTTVRVLFPLKQQHIKVDS
ncbi:MAG: PAS domain S-box protein [bacterium]|nr:PAS domain S-box protein [bacterium]